MSAMRRLFSGLVRLQHGELARALALAGLYFLVICTIGILKPIKNAFALDGLADSEFYKVYLVSAVVMLFVLPYNKLADRVAWRRLIPSVALFFALNLLAFRLFYRTGSTSFGVVFYGWYDLYAAVMVTQFFMATQLFLDARAAKRLYPIAIAGGSVGGVAGSAITGFFAQTLGGPNLLLVAASFVVVFALALPLLWGSHPAEGARGGQGARGARGPARKPWSSEKLTAGELTSVFRDRHVLLIAAAVLLTVLVKQLVDYQFNEISKEAFSTRDAIGAFQGKFFAATQWLPIIVLVALRPLLQRWGVALVVLMLPVVLLGANLAVALTWSLYAAIGAKAGDMAFRYTAERAGREILYVPLPENIKLKAKAYIDMAVEKGLGKVLSAALIFVALLFIDYRKVGYLGVGLGAIWLLVAIAVRGEYVRSLGRSIQGRFASFRGVFASMADASTLPAIRKALASGDERQIAFALDLIDQVDADSARKALDELHNLLEHPTAQIRQRALLALADLPDDADWAAVRRKVEDPDPAVRRTAVRTLCQADVTGPRDTMRALLRSREPVVRLAALSCLVEDGDAVEVGDGLVEWAEFEAIAERAQRGDRQAKRELALSLLALGRAPDVRPTEVLGPLLRESDPQVVNTALRVAGRLGIREFIPRLINALAVPETREAARGGLVAQGERVEGTLSDYLHDDSVELAVRRNIPSVLAKIASQATVDDTLRFLATGPADRLLRYRTLKSLNKLRARHPDLRFEPDLVRRTLAREIESNRRYARVLSSLHGVDAGGPVCDLLGQAVREAWHAGRERIFRILGLLYPGDEIYRSYLALSVGSARAQANAVEWLEQTVGRSLFVRLGPAIQDDGGNGGDGLGLRQVLTEVAADDDMWLARTAAWAMAESQAEWAKDELRRLRDSSNAELSFVAEKAIAAIDREETDVPPEGREMNLIEKVFLLQQVDLLQNARSEDLALLAAIAEEIEVASGSVLIEQGEPTEALFVVIDGAVELKREGERVLTAQQGTPFGTWALIDESPSLVTARAAKETMLLRIGRDEFYDLLADHSELTRDLLKGLARRVRTLVA